MSNPLSRLDTIRALRLTQYEAALATVFGTLVTGIFVTDYALWLKANSFWIGVLAMIPTLVGLAQPLSSYFVERAGRRKPFVTLMAGLGRGIWILIIPIGFVVPEQFRLATFLTLLTLSWLFLTLTGAPYVSWLTDLVPEDQRGRFFSRRSVVATGTTIVISMPFAWVLDRVNHGVALPIIFGIAVVFAALALSCTVRIDEPPMAAPAKPQTRTPWLELFAGPLLDRAFRPLLQFFLVFNFSGMIYGSFVIVYMRNTLHFTNMWTNNMCIVVIYAAMLASLPVWGYLADKFGNRPVGAIGLYLSLLWPPLMLVSLWPGGVGRYIIVGIAQVIGGIFNGALVVSHFNLLIGSIPAEKRTAYIAGYSAIIGVTGSVSPLVGGVLMQALGKFHYDIHLLGWALPIESFQILCLACLAVRLTTPFLYARVRDPHAATTKELLDQITSPATLTGLVHMRKLDGWSGRRTSARG